MVARILSIFLDVTSRELMLRIQSPTLTSEVSAGLSCDVKPVTIILELSEGINPGMIPKYASHIVALLPNLCLIFGSTQVVKLYVRPAYKTERKNPN